LYDKGVKYIRAFLPNLNHWTVPAFLAGNNTDGSKKIRFTTDEASYNRACSSGRYGWLEEQK
jgi:hypothetical protein